MAINRMKVDLDGNLSSVKIRIGIDCGNVNEQFPFFFLTLAKLVSILKLVSTHLN